MNRKIAALLRRDRRYPFEAYRFVHEALQYGTQRLHPVAGGPVIGDPSVGDPAVGDKGQAARNPDEPEERHVTGQELCDAIRRYAVEQYGMMAKVVLNNWGMYQTSDFGEIVYNLIEVNWMRKSESDRREHFDDVYDFDEAFVQEFRIRSQ